MSAGYVVTTTANVALSAATAKTVLSVISASGALLRLVEASISFDGTSGTATPVLVELCKSTQAGAGTSTSQTPVQVRGSTRTAQASGARNYTVEPTTLTPVREWLIHPQTGFAYQLPLGREIEQTASGNALCLRVTAPASVNCRAFMDFEEG